MIHPLSPHTPGTDATERSTLVDALTRRVDANGDGEATSAEFTHFLSALMQSLDDEQAQRGSTGAEASSAAAGAPQPAGDAAPMTPAQAARALRQAFEPTTRSR